MGIFIENGTVEILYASLLVFWFIYIYFVKDYGYWEERGVPHTPAVFPFVSMKETVSPSKFFGISLNQIYNKFKDERYVGLFVLRKPILLIKDPELIRHILEKDFSHFTDHALVDRHPKEYIANNLFVKKGHKWRDMRSKLTPAYTVAKMKMMFFLVKQCSDILREAIEKVTEINNIVDVKEISSRFTIDVIAACAFGIEINSLTSKNSDFYRMGMKCTEFDLSTSLKLFIHHLFPIFKKFHFFNTVDPKICGFFKSVIRSTVEYREKHNISKCDFLDLLIKLKQNQSILEEGEKPADLQDNSTSENREGLTIEEITAETVLFFTAGFETTSITIMFCLYELACSSRIQDKLYMEVEEVLDRHNDDITYQALQEMTYMDQVINETLRHYPPFPCLTRTCTQNYRVPNSTLEIEKGVDLVIPTYALHHDPKYFPDPYTFDPERFSPDHCEKRNSHVYLPFGVGPRMCIGQKFGLMNVKTALVTLVSNYQFSLTPDTDVPLKFKKKAAFTVPSKPLMNDN